MIRIAAFAAAVFLGMSSAAGAAAPPAADAHVLLVGLNVSDLQRSTDFYAKVLGMKETRRYTFPEVTEVLMGYGGANEASVVLVWRKGRPGPYTVGDGFSRVGVSVPDVRKVLVAAKAAGVKDIAEPRELQGSTLGFITDPDGYRIELVQMR
jgi:lactoylglutathione lyase